DTPVKRYSSGMYVRLAFAVAAHLEPEILIVDEVLAVGDTAFQDKCLGRMRDTASRGRTVLFVSHHMASIRQLCNRVLVLKAGCVAVDDMPAEAINAYHADSRSRTAEGLRDWPDRDPNATGQARIVRLEIRDLEGESVNSVAFGEPVRMSLDVEFREPVTNP